MKTDIEKVFAEYKSIYTNIFERFYPAKRSNGFTERNQSVNFSKAFENVYSDAFSWFELPYGGSSKEHIDAVIFNPAEREIFLVESKRFSNPNKKVVEVFNDIYRLSKRNGLGIIDNDEWNRYENYNFFGVILADVWTENKIKKQIYGDWGIGFFQTSDNSKYLSEEEGYDEIDYIINKSDRWFKCDFADIAKDKTYNIGSNYKLLMLAWEI